jgi:hypothetical protein
LLGLTDEEIEQRFAGSPDRVVRPEGANHLWRRVPQLSIDPVVDERLGRETGRAGSLVTKVAFGG